MAGLIRITDLPAAGTITGDELLEVSQLSTSVTRTATTISAQASDNSYNDSGSGFVTAGFVTGDRVRVSGFTGNTANNILVGVVTDVTAGKLTIGGADGNVIVDDAAGESVTITKWVSRRVAVDDLPGGGGSAPTEIEINTQAGAYTLVLSDSGKYVRMTSATAVNLTVPTNASVAFPVGTIVQVRQAGAGQITLVASGGVTVNTAETLKLRKNGSTAALVKISTDGWDLTGDLEAV
jgi:hypothetical protein